MSTHLLIAAAYLDDLPQGTTKLVLMAIADSGDEHTLESAPGLPKLRAWSGLGKSQTLRVVSQLVDAGYVERLLAGRVGRRAVFRVFPHGVPAIPNPSDVAARYANEDAGSRPCDPLDVSTGVNDPVDNDPSRVAPARPSGSHEAPSRVAPTGPLHASTSVSTRERTGFPGARPVDGDAQGARRRAKGAADQPCPRHPDQIVPCGRCAHVAANADPAKVAAARKLARDGIRAAATPTT